ncbi:MAG: DUF998 domain-containing protein [Candidatus Marinimicrobia bacterium]|nr:DUF998 domain-containing protein [Candidatus Neomarinimicrobiota bacterium]
MIERSKTANALIFSYLTLRKIIGILAISFPVVLFLGAVIFFQTGLQSSVSSYYHTGMGDVFVGTLFAIGFFLLSYKGYLPIDDLVANIASVSAVGLALFPTTLDNPAEGAATFIGNIHFAFAALFLICLVYFSLVLFTKTDPEKTPSPRKLQRNMVYRVCGYIMSLCILLIAIYFLILDGPESPLAAYQPVFWLEAIAVMVFGISWLTKGEVIWKDVAEH